MDLNLINYLKNNNILYESYSHKPTFTVEESKKIKEKIPSKLTKCLFLKDNLDQFYLIVLSSYKRLNIKLMKSLFNIKKINFASESELKQILHSTPGSVSIFGAIHNKSIFLILDEDIWNAKKVGFHPNINNFTFVLDHKNLEKFYNSLDIKKKIMML